MNIKEAKQHIRNAMVSYFAKDELGNYEIPIEEQRPIFLIGPPGVGKTAIMQQVANELGVNLVSYSMTHHTRQSAMGLPYITERVYDGKTYPITEYTMSEIIASVYDMIEQTGVKEGILFLDEINCVSETLAPTMLQFLQYKTFGTHRVPNGWIIVTAGNPPEYNNSVREFDIATADRLKPMEVQPNYRVWKEHAYGSGIHPAVLTFLDIHSDHFYSIETTVDGKSFVTARGWSDLSRAIISYEKHGLPVNEALVGQYLQNRKIAKEFAIYYDLWHKYRSDYQVDAILDGIFAPDIIHRAANGRFDERLALLGLLLDALLKQTREVQAQEKHRDMLLATLKEIKQCFLQPNADPIRELEKVIALEKGKLEQSAKITNRNIEWERERRHVLSFLEKHHAAMCAKAPRDVKEAFSIMKADFDRCTACLKDCIAQTQAKLENAYKFCETVFGNKQEILILTTELTVAVSSSHFINRYGCEKYFEHNKGLLIHDQRNEILHELEELDLL